MVMEAIGGTWPQMHGGVRDVYEIDSFWRDIGKFYGIAW